MPSLSPLSSPGAFIRYSFLSRATHRHFFTHLCKVYRTQTFRRVGPPKDVLRMYAVRSCHSAQAAYFDILRAVFSRGFGQHPVVCFHLGQCNGALGRSTPSRCHKEAVFSHRRVRRNIHHYDCGTLSPDHIARPSLMFIYLTKLLVPWLMMVCSCLPYVPC